MKNYYWRNDFRDVSDYPMKPKEKTKGADSTGDGK
jgi:hypothetical protein